MMRKIEPALCKDCIYCIKEESRPINSDKSSNIKYICSRLSASFTDGAEVSPNGLCCHKFTPRNPQEDKEVEKNSTAVPALNIAIEIPEPDTFCKVKLSVEGIELSQKVAALIVDIVKALNDEIKEKKNDEQT